MHRFFFGSFFFVLSTSAMGSAMLPFSPTPSEMALLPEFCRVRATDNQNSPEFQSWMQRIGPKFLGIHHYCAGINYINRYQYRIADKHRKYYLSRAVPEIDYIAKEMPPEFPLASEIYLNRGIALKLMGKDAEALADFNRSIDRDPRQAAAYLVIADYHIKAKNKPKALEIVSAGLKNAPDNKRLQRKYLELGGKEPFPSAEVQPTPDKGTGPQDPIKPRSTENLATPQSAPANVQVPDPNTGGSGVAASVNTVRGEKTQNEPSTPGMVTPGNPYCRFCP